MPDQNTFEKKVVEGRKKAEAGALEFASLLGDYYLAFLKLLWRHKWITLAVIAVLLFMDMQSGH